MHPAYSIVALQGKRGALRSWSPQDNRAAASIPGASTENCVPPTMVGMVAQE